MREGSNRPARERASERDGTVGGGVEVESRSVGPEDSEELTAESRKRGRGHRG